MNKKLIRLTESDLHRMVKESVDKILEEADRHRKGYWKERWAKQKAEKEAQKKKEEEQGTQPEQQKEKSKPKRKDRHRKGYYREYNKKHPERLNRGFTKGYKNGNVSDGPEEDDRTYIAPGVYIIGWDEFGMPITNDPIGDLLRRKETEWHDEDWCEDVD